MHYSLYTSVVPTTEPITLAETKAHLRVDDDITDQDALIAALIKAAREWTENWCRRSWCDQTKVLRMDCFPAYFHLPRGPVRSVSSIAYTDASGNPQTLAASQYEVDIYSTPPRIYPPDGVVWPTTKITLNAVTVTYLTGYGTGGSPEDLTVVPFSVKAAMKLLIGHWFENRELVLVGPNAAEVPMAVKALLSAYEVRDYTLE